MGHRATTWLRSCLPSAERRHLVVMMWRRERVLSLVLLVWILFNAFWPVALVVSMSRVVGSIPNAASHGISSPQGHHLLTQLVVFGALYFALLASSPLGSGLQTLLRARLSRDYQQRLIAAVSGPVGVQHLEDPAVLDKIELAQGSLVAVYPADAPFTYASVLTMRIQGTLSCVVLGAFRWWMGLAFALAWLAVRRPIRSTNQMQVRTFEARTSRMRRAWYFTGLSLRPGAAKEVRVFGLGGWLVDQLDRHWRDGMSEVWKRDARRAQILPVLGLFLSAVYVGCITYVTHLAAGGHVAIGELSLLLGLMPGTLSIAGISVGDGQLYWMLSALPKLDELERELLDSSRQLSGATDVGSMPRRAIRFESVDFSYPGGGSPVFEGLSLEIAAGTSTAIVGANGAGKTTLVKLLARLHDPVRGRITADGHDIEELDPQRWQQRIAVVFQDFNRYPVSVRDNIAYGSIANRDDQVGIEAAARSAGALGFIDALPKGWDTVLSREFSDGTDLSGGQWQRLALARALFAVQHQGGVLVLDEPTSWMDVRGEAEFYDRFIGLTQGLTTVVISHRFSTVRLADRICVLEHGRLSEEGSHEQLLARGGLYSEMFRLQASRFTDADPAEGAS